MKFAKKLAAEAARRWRPFYLDYKALKKALAVDVAARDAAGTHFGLVLRAELQKVGSFFVDKEEELQAVMQILPSRPAPELSAFRREVADLKKFAALNYVAVMKAVKKRNRHLREACGEDAVTPLTAVQVLAAEYFFTSPRLAALATHAEVLAAREPALSSAAAAGDALAQLQCSICLSVLHMPVVLTCEHRFCWACLLSHCASSAARRQQLQQQEAMLGHQWHAGPKAAAHTPALGWGKGPSTAGVASAADGTLDPGEAGAAVVEAWPGMDAGRATYDCPVCRKAHVLDLDRLQVDPHLLAHIQELRRCSGLPPDADSSGPPVLLHPNYAGGASTTVLLQHQPPALLRLQLQGGVGRTAGRQLLWPQPMDEDDGYGGDADEAETQGSEPETPSSSTSSASVLAEEAGAAVGATTAGPAAAGEEDMDSLPTGDRVEDALAGGSVAVCVAGVAERQCQEREDVAAEEGGMQPDVEDGALAAPPVAPEQDGPMHSPFATATPAAAAAATIVAACPPALPGPLVDRHTLPESEAPTPCPTPSLCHAAHAVPLAPPSLPEPQQQREKALQDTAKPARTIGEATGSQWLLPPRPPGQADRLTVVLDLDGTLVSSYSPRRAPVLGPGSIGYLVGKGRRLNPQGVWVVERPGLREFFTRLSAVAEVVLFTAGLEDYAEPIADALAARYGDFSARLYRPATVSSEVYPCVKDLARLGRDLGRMVLVDDTPLAFYHQPDNGIPILNFRSNPDDRILTEVVAPLVEALAGAGDVRHLLRRRFNMGRWFWQQGLPAPPQDSVACQPPAVAGAAGKQAPDGPQDSTPSPSDVQPPSTVAPATAVAQSVGPAPAAASGPRPPPPGARTLLVCDFDRTLTDYDAGERLVGELAPELVPALQALEMPANFIPLTNSVLAEMQRRGVSRDRLLHTLHSMGAEFPSASRAMLRWASSVGIDVRVLSDCNNVFISHMLAGAGVGQYVHEVLTNAAGFETAPAGASLQCAGAQLGLPEPCSVVAGLDAISSSKQGCGTDEEASMPAGPQQSAQRLQARQQLAESSFESLSAASFSTEPCEAPSASSSTVSFSSVGAFDRAAPQAQHPKQQHAPAQRLVIRPRFDYHSRQAHGCKLCPENLCKGSELRSLRRLGITPQAKHSTSAATSATDSPRFIGSGTAPAPQQQRQYQRVLYCGDGANDLCPALELTESDVLLVRRGYGLERLVRDMLARGSRPSAGGGVGQAAVGAGGPAGDRCLRALVKYWDDHEELFELVRQYAVL